MRAKTFREISSSADRIANAQSTSIYRSQKGKKCRSIIRHCRSPKSPALYRRQNLNIRHALPITRQLALKISLSPAYTLRCDAHIVVNCGRHSTGRHCPIAKWRVLNAAQPAASSRLAQDSQRRSFHSMNFSPASKRAGSTATWKPSIALDLPHLQRLLR